MTGTPGPNTATLAAIRAWIKPAPRWWQFELHAWHYRAAGTTTAALVIAAIALIATRHS